MLKLIHKCMGYMCKFCIQKSFLEIHLVSILKHWIPLQQWETCSSSHKGMSPDLSWIWPPLWGHPHDLEVLDLCRGRKSAVPFSSVGFESRTSLCQCVHMAQTLALLSHKKVQVTSLLTTHFPAGTGLSHFPGMLGGGETSHFAWEIFTNVNCPSVKICLASTGPCLCP